MGDSLEQRVTREIEALHEFFVGWFPGVLPESSFEPEFLNRFAPELVFIPPAGTLLGLSDLASSVRAGFATNPDFRVQIRNVRVHREIDGHVLATYEEWQRNARASTPPDNGRLATVLFRETGERLEWLHIHETWLPADVMERDPFDF